MPFLRPDIVVLLITAVMAGTIILAKKTTFLRPLAIAFLVSLLWNLIAHGQYGYNQEFMMIGPVSMFPLFAWTSGLFGIFLIFYVWNARFRLTGITRQLLLFLLLYWPLLIALETIGYASLNIQNLAAARYPGLPFCDCLHAPAWMQAAYFLLGPLYFMIISLFFSHDTTQRRSKVLVS